MRIRKQVHELTIEDLEAHPAWQFALDEEAEEGQDEATVRPVGPAPIAGISAPPPKRRPSMPSAGRCTAS